MRILKCRQSATSPLKYCIELKPEEMRRLSDKKLRVDIIKNILKDVQALEIKENNE